MLCRSVRDPLGADMKSHTVYKTFNTSERREFVRLTDDVQQAVDDAGIAEGMALVSAMHITAAVWINDDEPGLHEDVLEWLDKLAPPSWNEPANDVARQLLPDPGDYRHHRGGEDNGDAHLKNLLVHHQVIVPVTEGRLDLGPWQQVFYCEFDGGRPKRMIIKVLGEGIRAASARRPGRRGDCPRPCRPSARGWRRSRSRGAAAPGRSARRAAGGRRVAAPGRSRRAPRPRSRPRE